MKATILSVVLAVTAIATSCFALGSVYGRSAMPQCQEDQVLVGEGNFEAGRWSTYVCGPAVDDYVQP